MTAIGEDLPHGSLARGLAAAIGRGSIGLGADRRDMDKRAGAHLSRRFRHVPGAFVLHRLEGLAPAGQEQAHQVDHGIGALRRREERGRVAHIGLHGVDLAHAAERLQMAGKLRPPHGHPHARAGLGDGPHHMAADEARAAIDGDERRAVEDNCQRTDPLPALPPPRRGKGVPQHYTTAAKPVKADRAPIDKENRQSYLRNPKPRWRNW